MDRLERHLDIEPIELSDAEIDALVAFLEALTGTDSVTSPVFGSPTAVPSGLLEM